MQVRIKIAQVPGSSQTQKKEGWTDGLLRKCMRKLPLSTDVRRESKAAICGNSSARQAIQWYGWRRIALNRLIPSSFLILFAVGLQTRLTTDMTHMAPSSASALFLPLPLIWSSTVLAHLYLTISLLPLLLSFSSISPAFFQFLSKWIIIPLFPMKYGRNNKGLKKNLNGEKTERKVEARRRGSK